MRVSRLLSVGLVTSMLMTAAGTVPVRSQEPREPAASGNDARPVFRSNVDLVSVAAVVRDRRGRVVRNLDREDFQILDKGEPRKIVEFSQSDAGPVSLAFLFDVSGSMDVSANLDAGRRAVEHVLGWMDPTRDEAALFAFDRQLRQLAPFTSDLEKLRRSLDRLEAFGVTSLYDAIAETARAVQTRDVKRRAVVVITDGVDTSSRLSPSEVSGIASSIDVPVYVIAVLSPLDDPQRDGSVAGATGEIIEGELANLTRWTGGTLQTVSAPSQASLAARQLLGELRHQYLIAFEAASEPGWRPLDIRTRRGHTVRARSGYFASQVRPAS